MSLVVVTLPLFLEPNETHFRSQLTFFRSAEIFDVRGGNILRVWPLPLSRSPSSGHTNSTRILLVFIVTL